MSTETVEPIQVKEETISRYFSLIEKEGRIPSLFSIDVLKPIPLNKGEQVLEPQTYFFIFDTDYLEDPSPIPPDALDTPLFTLESHNILPNDKLDPIMITTGNKQTPLTFLEAIVWAAFNDAKEAGDTEQANKIYNTVFAKNEECDTSHTVSGMKEKTDIQAENGLSDSEPILFGMDTERDMPNIKLNKIPRVHFTTDKVNNSAWSLWEGLAANGEEGCGLSIGNKTNLQINTANEADDRKGIKRLITCLIDFNELEETGIVKHLEPYDKRVYEALSSLHLSVTEETGQDCFSLNDVHYAMGETTKPNKKTREKILTSVIKLTKTHIHLDNKEEADAYNYKHYTYDASLLPAEIITARVEGQITEGVIHLFREPPLFTFARQREQITAADVKLLQIPLNKTNKNLMLDDYLRGQIKWMKNKNRKRSNKITFEDMFKKTKLTGRKEKARQKTNALKLLEHYKKCGEIKNFKEVENGFVITI
jgi:hypothetical protein